MIKLETKYYCHDCPYFEAEVLKAYSFGNVTTIITCENAEKCKDLYKRFTAIDKAASEKPECDL